MQQPIAEPIAEPIEEPIAEPIAEPIDTVCGAALGHYFCCEGVASPVTVVQPGMSRSPPGLAWQA